MRKAGGASIWLWKTGGMAVFNVRLARKPAGWAAFNPPSDMNGKGGSGGSGVFCGGRAFRLHVRRPPRLRLISIALLRWNGE